MGQFSQPSNTSRHQTGVSPLQQRTTHEVEQRRAEGSHIPTHRQGTTESLALQDREGEQPQVQVRRNTECGPFADFGMCGRHETNVGRDVDR